MKAVQSDVDAVGPRGVEKNVLGAEGLRVGAEVGGVGVEVGGDSEKGGSQEYHGEPASEGKEVDAFATEKVGVVGLFHKAGGFVVSYLHSKML